MRSIITLRRPIYLRDKTELLREVNLLQGEVDTARSTGESTLIAVSAATYIGKSDISNVLLSNLNNVVIPTSNILGIHILESELP